MKEIMKRFLLLFLLMIGLVQPIYGKEKPIIQIGLNQADVIKSIGKPNIITHDFEQSEVWIYEKLSKLPLVEDDVLEKFSDNKANTIFLIKFDTNGNIKSYSYHKNLI